MLQLLLTLLGFIVMAIVGVLLGIRFCIAVLFRAFFRLR
jgi:hypothetical protein